MRQIDIPGGTATLREHQDIRQRDRKPVMSAGIAAMPALTKIQAQVNVEKLDIVGGLARLNLTAPEMEAFQELQNAVIVACMAAWSLPEPLPTLATVEDLPAGLWTTLANATAEDVGTILNGTSFEPVAPSSPGFESSPTGPSAESDYGLRAEAESELTRSGQDGGASSDSEASSTDSLMTTT